MGTKKKSQATNFSFCDCFEQNFDANDRMSHGVSRVKRKAMIFIISVSQTALFASRFHFKKACWVGLGLENRVMQPMSNIQPPSGLQVLQFKIQCFYFIVRMQIFTNSRWTEDPIIRIKARF